MIFLSCKIFYFVWLFVFLFISSEQKGDQKEKEKLNCPILTFYVSNTWKIKLEHALHFSDELLVCPRLSNVFYLSGWIRSILLGEVKWTWHLEFHVCRKFWWLLQEILRHLWWHALSKLGSQSKLHINPFCWLHSFLLSWKFQVTSALVLTNGDQMSCKILLLFLFYTVFLQDRNLHRDCSGYRIGVMVKTR